MNERLTESLRLTSDIQYCCMSVLKKLTFAFLIIFALIGVAFSAVFVSMRFGLLNVRGSIDERNRFFLGGIGTEKPLPKQPCADERDMCEWNETPEWAVVEGGLIKDKATIERVSRETGVPARIIASVVIPEQIRFFTSEREIYKRYFEPLKILASLSQFSLGVSGIKQETAALIELNATDKHSPFYPGEQFAPYLAYAANTEHDQTLYERLTDAKDHYYSYLYTAIYIKEVEEQWKRAGFDISNNPEIIATLFNLGFSASKPNAAPVAGGAAVSVGGKTYSYGLLAGDFWHSDELLNEFPK